MDDPATIGNPVAMQRFHEDTDIFLFWSYGNSVDVIGPTITDLAVQTVNSMGGIVEKVILQGQFKHFPHVGPEGILNIIDNIYNIGFVIQSLNRVN